MENEDELVLYNHQLISILNSSVKVYHKVQIMINKGNGFIKWVSCFLKLSLSYTLVIFVQILLLFSISMLY